MRALADDLDKVRDSDELEWLMATSWNQGLDLLQSVYPRTEDSFR